MASSGVTNFNLNTESIATFKNTVFTDIAITGYMSTVYILSYNLTYVQTIPYFICLQITSFYKSEYMRNTEYMRNIFCTILVNMEMA